MACVSRLDDLTLCQCGFDAVEGRCAPSANQLVNVSFCDIPKTPTPQNFTYVLYRLYPWGSPGIKVCYSYSLHAGLRRYHGAAVAAFHRIMLGRLHPRNGGRRRPIYHSTLHLVLRYFHKWYMVGCSNYNVKLGAERHHLRPGVQMRLRNAQSMNPCPGTPGPIKIARSTCEVSRHPPTVNFGLQVNLNATSEDSPCLLGSTQ